MIVFSSLEESYHFQRKWAIPNSFSNRKNWKKVISFFQEMNKLVKQYKQYTVLQESMWKNGTTIMFICSCYFFFHSPSYNWCFEVENAAVHVDFLFDMCFVHLAFLFTPNIKLLQLLTLLSLCFSNARSFLKILWMGLFLVLRIAYSLIFFSSVKLMFSYYSWLNHWSNPHFKMNYFCEQSKLLIILSSVNQSELFPIWYSWCFEVQSAAVFAITLYL